MRFTVTGIKDGHTVEITWDHGELYGNEMAINLVREIARLMEGHEVAATPTGPFSYNEHLSNPHSALFFISEALDTIEDITGDDPGEIWIESRIY